MGCVRLQRGSVTTVIYLMIPCHFAFALVLPHPFPALHFFKWRSFTPSFCRVHAVLTDTRHYHTEVLHNDLDHALRLILHTLKYWIMKESLL